jgi:hypothetical protein
MRLNMNVGAVIVCRSRAPTAAVFMPSPRLNLSPNVITARVTRRRAQGVDEYGRVSSRMAHHAPYVCLTTPAMNLNLR